MTVLDFIGADANVVSISKIILTIKSLVALHLIVIRQDLFSGMK